MDLYALRGILGGLSGNLSPQGILLWALQLLVLFFSISCHEYAHAKAAHKLGDDTAFRLGRLTINPLAHIEPIGLLFMLFAPVGWMKPVPVNPSRFTVQGRLRRYGFQLVAAAGPAMNLVIAFIANIVLHLLPFTISNAQMTDGTFLLFQFFSMMVLSNIYLAAFNLLPVPPLDGFNIYGGFLPERVQQIVRANMHYISLALFFLLWVPGNPLTRILSTIAQGVLYVFNAPLRLLGL